MLIEGEPAGPEPQAGSLPGVGPGFGPSFGPVAGSRSGIVRILLAGLLVVCVAAAAAMSLRLLDHQRAMGRTFRYDVTWNASQTLVIALRLQAAAAALELGTGDPDQVALWFEVAKGGLATLSQGDQSLMFRDNAEHLRMLQDFRDALADLEEPMARLDAPGAGARVFQRLRPAIPGLASLASYANRQEAESVVATQEQVSRDHWQLTALLAVLVVYALLMAAMLSRRNRLLRRAHAETGQLAESLRRTGADLAAANHAVRVANGELSLQNGRFHAALENMSQALCMVDASQRLIVCNRRFVEMFGLDAAQARPGALMRDLAPASGDPAAARTMRDLQAEHRKLSRQHRPSTFLHECPDQKVLAVSHQPMPDSAWVATYEDVTERRQAEARIAFLAHHDSLTGLANRVLYRQRIEYIVATGGADSGDIAVLLLDLDHFKEVNDTLGHGVGDALLSAVGLRLRGCTRESDLVARLGGDEFAIIQFPATQPEDAAMLAARIVETIGRPYAIDGERVMVSASVGIAAARVGGASAELLLKYADMALYQAKANGRAGYCFYDPAMDLQMQTRRALSADLRDALSLGQFEVHYQPIVSIEQERICGFEALIRWRHPERGLVSPAQFIPLAEETGLIQSIGEWVLREASAEATRWPAQLKVAVNLSPRQFRGNDVARAVELALDHSGLAPERLEVEITESLLLQDGDDVLDALRRLRALGVGVALDDFGTGYSSLSYLRKFPFSKLKIDQSFVRGMTEREDCIIIIQAVSAMAQRLGMIVTAEGIETEEELAIIRAAGCTQGQGYLFGRPQNAASTLALLGEAGKAGVAEFMLG